VLFTIDERRRSQRFDQASAAVCNVPLLKTVAIIVFAHVQMSVHLLSPEGINEPGARPKSVLLYKSAPECRILHLEFQNFPCETHTVT